MNIIYLFWGNGNSNYFKLNTKIKVIFIFNQIKDKYIDFIQSVVVKTTSNKKFPFSMA
jgi:hypothetical protein